jgi:hypothetical protein
MKLIKLTALSSLVFASFIILSSCEKRQEANKRLEYSRTQIVMSGAQEVPATTSGALGYIDVTYRKDTRVLTYRITWTGLTGNPTSIGIHGLAPIGYVNIPSTTAAIQAFTLTGLTATGSYSGTVVADGFAIKEPDLLNGFYFINIKTAANPNGEIRGQILFQ